MFYFVNNHDGSDLPIGGNIIVTFIGINYDLTLYQNKIDIYFIALLHQGHPSAVNYVTGHQNCITCNFCAKFIPQFLLYYGAKREKKGEAQEYIPFFVCNLCKDIYNPSKTFHSLQNMKITRMKITSCNFVIGQLTPTSVTARISFKGMDTA